MKSIASCLVVVLVVALMGLGPALAADPAAGPIKVGVVLPLTGEQAQFGEIEKNSFLMGLEEINKAGGVNGKQIELLIEDDTGKPDVGRSAVEKLISRDNVIVPYRWILFFSDLRHLCSSPAAQSPVHGDNRFRGQHYGKGVGLRISDQPSGQ